MGRQAVRGWDVLATRIPTHERSRLGSAREWAVTDLFTEKHYKRAIELHDLKDYEIPAEYADSPGMYLHCFEPQYADCSKKLSNEIGEDGRYVWNLEDQEAFARIWDLFDSEWSHYDDRYPTSLKCVDLPHASDQTLKKWGLIYDELRVIKLAYLYARGGPSDKRGALFFRVGRAYFLYSEHAQGCYLLGQLGDEKQVISDLFDWNVRERCADGDRFSGRPLLSIDDLYDYDEHLSCKSTTKYRLHGWSKSQNAEYAAFFGLGGDNEASENEEDDADSDGQMK
ncbi:hypothetical protein BJ508DRAFT_327389 [Ascobolus immersus RN42]|uniref:Uncharacterized protein n=1 Tax=Ascobolus immersus RN42 TaxID=1160509 RepID=A0A3N4I724_ASCIM|nr:hypothetical protein BJ508DRAFT_327389 [Ascobolus immersus RN42]